MSDVVECITDKLKLFIDCLHTETVDRIVECYIDFKAHSKGKLDNIVALIDSIDGVDEAHGVNIE